MSGGQDRHAGAAYISILTTNQLPPIRGFAGPELPGVQAAACCRWQQEWVEAKTAMQGREAKVAAVAEGIERRLVLLGCTAIEDKLQEGVPEAIEHLAQAGIALWVLTGDKQVSVAMISVAGFIGGADCVDVQHCYEAWQVTDAWSMHGRNIQAPGPGCGSSPATSR